MKNHSHKAHRDYKGYSISMLLEHGIVHVLVERHGMNLQLTIYEYPLNDGIRDYSSRLGRVLRMVRCYINSFKMIGVTSE